MFTTIIIILLLVLWLFGFFVFHVGSLIHLLLVIALILVIKRLLQERKAQYKAGSENQQK